MEKSIVSEAALAKYLSSKIRLTSTKVLERGVYMSELNKKYEMIFKDRKQETSEICSFVFTKPNDFHWIPGQHGIFRFPEYVFEKDKGYRIFSFTSVEEDDIVMFSSCTYERDDSEFKHRLMALKEGDLMTVEDPQGRFIINTYEVPICILARGIGITPVRSILRHLELSGENPAKIKVYYMDEKSEYAFKDNLELIDKKIPGLEIEFLSDLGVLKDRAESFARIMGNEALYYTSGSPGVNGMLIESWFDLGIDKTRIKADNFIGY